MTKIHPLGLLNIKPFCVRPAVGHTAGHPFEIALIPFADKSGDTAHFKPPSETMLYCGSCERDRSTCAETRENVRVIISASKPMRMQITPVMKEKTAIIGNGVAVKKYPLVRM